MRPDAILEECRKQLVRAVMRDGGSAIRNITVEQAQVFVDFMREADSLLGDLSIYLTEEYQWQAIWAKQGSQCAVYIMVPADGVPELGRDARQGGYEVKTPEKGDLAAWLEWLKGEWAEDAVRGRKGEI